MNIIQIQDRLKGVPDQELVGYVETPTGSVPTYLALGELQRRKDMRERYESQQAPESSVAEKLVDEVKPKGIAGMMPGMPAPTQGIGAPQPQPQMTPEMLASSGVGALPAGNIGQNFAGGGIVAFEEGGEVEEVQMNEEGEVEYGIGGKIRDLIFGKKGIKEIPTPTKEVSVLDKTTRVPVAGPGRPAIPGTGGALGFVKNNPIKSGILGTAGAYYMLSDNNEKIPVSDEEVAALDQSTIPEKEEDKKDNRVVYNPPKFPTEAFEEVDPKAYGEERMKAYREFIGEDSVSPRLEKRLAGLEEGLAKQKDLAPYMALTEAGLAIAAGRSQDAITNIATGATQGMKSYTDELKDIRAREKEMFDIDSEILKAKRAEQVAVGTKGFDSMEAAEARNRTAQLEKFKAEQDAAKTQYQGDVDIRGKEISATTYGYNTKSASAVLAQAKAMQYENERGILNNLQRAYIENPTEKNKKAVDVQRALVDRIMKEAEILVLGAQRRPTPPPTPGQRVLTQQVEQDGVKYNLYSDGSVEQVQ
jgi:hypothetical protein